MNQNIGMSSMFDGSRADFSGISNKTDVYVSSVNQKAFIEVNEVLFSFSNSKQNNK